mgnify:CR=1 FL=1
MSTRTIPAGEFKAKCFALLEEVAQTGERIIVTKRGKPLAEVGPIPGHEADGLASSFGKLAHLAISSGDVVAPAVGDGWEEEMLAEWDELHSG